MFLALKIHKKIYAQYKNGHETDNKAVKKRSDAEYKNMNTKLQGGQNKSEAVGEQENEGFKERLVHFVVGNKRCDKIAIAGRQNAWADHPRVLCLLYLLLHTRIKLATIGKLKLCVVYTYVYSKQVVIVDHQDCISLD